MKFYQQVFGWQPSEAMDMGAMGNYQMFNRPHGMIGGMMNKPPEMANVPPNWQIYFRVPDVHAAAERDQGERRADPERADGSPWRRLDRQRDGSAGRGFRASRQESPLSPISIIVGQQAACVTRVQANDIALRPFSTNDQVAVSCGQSSLLRRFRRLNPPSGDPPSPRASQSAAASAGRVPVC